VPAP